MRRKKLPPAIKAVGFALIILSFGLAFWGYQLYGAIGTQVAIALTGSSPDKLMNIFIASAVSFLIGLFISIRR